MHCVRLQDNVERLFVFILSVRNSCDVSRRGLQLSAACEPHDWAGLHHDAVPSQIEYTSGLFLNSDLMVQIKQCVQFRLGRSGLNLHCTELNITTCRK